MRASIVTRYNGSGSQFTTFDILLFQIINFSFIEGVKFAPFNLQVGKLDFTFCYLFSFLKIINKKISSFWKDLGAWRGLCWQGEKKIKIPVNGPTLDFISIPPKTEGFQKHAHPPSELTGEALVTSQLVRFFIITLAKNK
jgi:hypothetical protein